VAVPVDKPVQETSMVLLVPAVNILNPNVVATPSSKSIPTSDALHF